MLYLISAWIQLKLEASQLGLARVAKILTIELVVYFFFLLISFRLKKVNLFKTNLNLMCNIVKKVVMAYINCEN